jgi:hypothetical protein
MRSTAPTAARKPKSPARRMSQPKFRASRSPVNPPEVLLESRGRDPVRHACDDEVTLDGPRGGGRRSTVGNPESDAAEREDEVGRHHTDHFVRNALELDETSYDTWVTTESALPKRVVQDHDLGARRAALPPGERATQERLGPQDVEEPLGDDASRDALRTLGTRDVEAPVVIRGHRFHSPGSLPEILDLRKREARPGKSARLVDVPYLDEAVRVGVGQGAEEIGVHHGEDGGVGPNAQRQGEHHHQGVSWALPQRANRVACVLNPPVEAHRPPLPFPSSLREPGQRPPGLLHVAEAP